MKLVDILSDKSIKKMAARTSNDRHPVFNLTVTVYQYLKKNYHERRMPDL